MSDRLLACLVCAMAGLVAVMLRPRESHVKVVPSRYLVRQSVDTTSRLPNTVSIH